LHQFCEASRAQEESIRLAGKFLEVPSLIKHFRGVADTIQNDGHEGESLTGLMCIAQSACEQALS
jgi:hypothetical protein